MSSLIAFLTPEGFMPHGHCFLWTPGLLWTYVLSDSLIALAYYSIPVALWVFVRRRRDLPFTWVFLLFAVFIFACGTTHVMGVVNIWQPAYWLDAGIKAATATASVVTALLLWPLLPRALSLPSQAQLEESNLRLQREIAERRLAERRVQELNELLEQRIAARTEDLEIANLELRREIDERRQVERALRDSQRLLRAVADNAAATIWVKDLEGRYLLIAGDYERMFDAAPEEIVGKTDFDLLPAEQAEVFREVDRQALATLEPVQAEEVFDHRGRRLTYLSAKCLLLDDNGAPYALCGISTEITERKRAEQALVDERMLLRTLIDALPDLVFTKNSAGRFTMCNQAELEHLGLEREQDLIGKTVFDLYPQKLAEVYHRDDLQALAGRSVLNSEELVLDAEGSQRTALSSKLPLRDHAGTIVGLVGISHDITERKRAEEGRMRAQKLEALGTLAGGVAHDFNNILLAVSGNTRLAMADLPPGHPVQQNLREIEKAGDRAAGLVRRILTFTRGQEPNRTQIQLQPLVAEAIELLRRTLPAMIQLDTAFPGPLPSIAGDVSQIHQILMNLGTNAAHAIGQRSGRIEFRLELVGVTQDMAAVMPELRAGRYVRLCASDDGCGMDKQTVARIFDPFFTTKPPGEGTGLGLSVVHGTMKSHGGAVSVYSAPGRGTTFHLYFPALEEQAGSVQDLAARRVVQGAGERVLYVDDEDALVTLVTRALGRLGYDVTGHTDPGEALRAFRKEPEAFDAVVTDLSMPGLSGFDLARELLEIRPDVPIVMTSGYLRPADQEAAAELRIVALILKPNTVEEVAETLDRLFSERRAKARAGPAPSA